MLLGLNVVWLVNGPSTARQIICQIKVWAKPVRGLKSMVKPTLNKKRCAEKKWEGKSPSNRQESKRWPERETTFPVFTLVSVMINFLQAVLQFYCTFKKVMVCLAWSQRQCASFNLFQSILADVMCLWNLGPYSSFYLQEGWRSKWKGGDGGKSSEGWQEWSEGEVRVGARWRLKREEKQQFLWHSSLLHL